MIQGLKVTVAGKEVRQLCLERAEHHTERWRTYAEQIENLTGANVEGMQYSSGDPIRALKDKRDSHLAQHTEMLFIAEHVDLNEQYLLASEDLLKLGITPSRW